MGEALISQGDIANGVEHLANAVIVCGNFSIDFSFFALLIDVKLDISGQPTQLLQVLQQTLPAEVFTLLIHRMREFQTEVSQAAPQGLKLAESTNDDLE